MKHAEEHAPLDPHWPKWKYHANGKSKLVGSQQEEKFLGGDWKDSPADHGVVTHPHSDEYLAQHGAQGESEPQCDGEPIVEAKVSRKGRQPKG